MALAGGVLDLAGQFHGGGIELRDFHIALLVVAIVSGLSTFTFMRLPADAGAAVSGHRRRAALRQSLSDAACWPAPRGGGRA